MGLRARLVLIVTLGLGVSFAATLAVLLRLETRDTAADTTRRTAALLSTLSVPSALLLTQGRLADLDSLMSELSLQHERLDLVSIVLVDHSGAILAEARAATAERDGPARKGAEERYGFDLAGADPFVAQAVATAAALQEPPPPAVPRRVSVPVQTGVRWATLIGEVNVERIQARMAARRVRLVASSMAVAVVGLLVLLLLMNSEIVNPLRDVVAMAGRLAMGDLKARTSVRGGTEIALLAHTLNDAARRLAVTKDELESEVARRTEELSSANQELSEVNARLERLAVTDPLTGLFNRRYLEQAVNAEITRQRRSQRPFSLLLLDVDHFKTYNDQNGHPAGDEVLRRLANLLTANVRASDVVARVGGEEFVVLLLDVELPRAMTAAENVRAAVSRHVFPLAQSQPGGRVTVSVGVASWPRHGQAPDDVMAAADRALYVSKAQGRDRATAAVDPPMPRGFAS